MVNCYYFVYRQRAEDRVLRALVRKTETIKKEPGSLAQVIEGKLADTLAGGIRHGDIERLEKEIDQADLDRDFKDTVREELEAARERQDELREQKERLQDLLKTSKNWLGLDDTHFRAALSSALVLMGAEPLQAAPDAPERFVFPALDRRKGGDPSWANTLDTLRSPRQREHTFWDWRRESSIRPVVFESPGTMTDDVVHLHLEHRVVQRLLGRFVAQGFVHNDLSWACLAQTADPIPRVILLGRLCLYGSAAARLHEELIAVTARWIDPHKRKGSLAPYGRDEAGKDRGKWLKERTDQAITGAALNALKTADTPEALAAALERKIARELTPNIVPLGSMCCSPATSGAAPVRTTRRAASPSRSSARPWRRS